MMPEKLPEIVCTLLALSGDIAGGVFSWTDASLRLFERISSGCALDEADLCALDRACEIGAGIARILRGRNLEPWFNDCRAMIAHNLSDCTLEDTLRQLRKKRADAEQDYSRAFKVRARKEDA